MSEKLLLNTPTIAARVTEQLREDIINKIIEPGSRITIKEVSERYGTSNMPVREAFRTLEGEKLLEINAYKGATVLRIDEGFVCDVYGLLRALECLIYETVMPDLTPEAIQSLRDLNQQIREVYESENNPLLYIDLNTEFHGILTGRCTNGKALELYRYYHGLIRSMRKSYVPRRERIGTCVGEHEALISALETRDLTALKAAVDIHVNHAKENFLELLEQTSSAT